MINWNPTFETAVGNVISYTIVFVTVLVFYLVWKYGLINWARRPKVTEVDVEMNTLDEESKGYE